MSAFCRECVKGHDPNQILPNEILPDYLDSDLPDHEHDVELEHGGEEQAANNDECIVTGIVRESGKTTEVAFLSLILGSLVLLWTIITVT